MLPGGVGGGIPPGTLAAQHRPAVRGVQGAGVAVCCWRGTTITKILSSGHWLCCLWLEASGILNLPKDRVPVKAVLAIRSYWGSKYMESCRCSKKQARGIQNCRIK